jgi:hypothetical protein
LCRLRQSFLNKRRRCRLANQSARNAERWNNTDCRAQRVKLVMCIDRVHLGAGVPGQLLPDFL